MSGETSGPKLPPETQAIDIRDAKSLAAIGTPQRCGVFEVLRCFRRPATLQELGVATRVPPLTLASIVDDLVGAGLVRARKARGARRRPAFEVTCQQVAVLYDPSVRSECDLVRRHLEAATADMQHASVQARAAGASPPHETLYHESRGKFTIRPDQFMELRRRLHAVDEFINQIATDCAVSDPVAPLLCNHLIEMRVAPLQKPLLPFPWILAAQRGTAASLSQAFVQSTVPQLAPREQQVAVAMAHGSSRPEIAKRLGLSVNTVASISKRIYAKLGISNRAELANRLAALSRV